MRYDEVMNAPLEQVAEFVAETLGLEYMDNGIFHPKTFTIGKGLDRRERDIIQMADNRGRNTPLWMSRGVMWEVARKFPDRAARLKARLEAECEGRVAQLRALGRERRNSALNSEFDSLLSLGMRALDGELTLRLTAAALASHESQA